MRSKLRASRVLAAGVVAAALAGGGVLGVTAVAGAQDNGNQPPAESGRPHGDHGGPGLDAAAQALHLSAADLRSKLEGGKTIAQVAQDQGVDVQSVIDAMVADATAHIDQAVQDGKLTADQANERKANLKDRITQHVNETKPKDAGRDRGPKLDAAAKALGVSTDDLRAQLRNGKTIAQVAQDRNVDKQKVIDAMVKDAQAHLDQAVKDGKLTADQANQREADLQQHITSLVDNGPPQDHDGGPGGPHDAPGGQPGQSQT